MIREFSISSLEESEGRTRRSLLSSCLFTALRQEEKTINVNDRRDQEDGDLSKRRHSAYGCIVGAAPRTVCGRNERQTFDQIAISRGGR